MLLVRMRTLFCSDVALLPFSFRSPSPHAHARACAHIVEIPLQIFVTSAHKHARDLHRFVFCLSRKRQFVGHCLVSATRFVMWQFWPNLGFRLSEFQFPLSSHGLCRWKQALDETLYISLWSLFKGFRYIYTHTCVSQKNFELQVLPTHWAYASLYFYSVTVLHFYSLLIYCIISYIGYLAFFLKF